VNEISCNACPDKASLERPKGKRHGMMHTHLRCKQREMKVVDAKIRLIKRGRKTAGNRRSLAMEDGSQGLE
jgi:hypothetical protein